VLEHNEAVALFVNIQNKQSKDMQAVGKPRVMPRRSRAFANKTQVTFSCRHKVIKRSLIEKDFDVSFVDTTY
jgi:hypothetical protein